MAFSTENLSRLLAIMAQLRDPLAGCPWDLKQTFASIVPYTLEEAYEVADAIERNDFEGLKEELGDLLLQVVYNAQMAQERHLFDFDDVARAVCDKLVRRHPHVFGNVRFDTEEEVSAAWEAHKLRERDAATNRNETASVLDGIAVVLPELVRAAKLQSRAARVGFDWPETHEIFFKIEEELEEVQQALESSETREHLQEELGDLLFAVVNLSRHLGINPEQALRQGNKKFERRFRSIEKRLAERGLEPSACTLTELDALWDEVKREEIK